MLIPVVLGLSMRENSNRVFFSDTLCFVSVLISLAVLNIIKSEKKIINGLQIKLKGLELNGHENITYGRELVIGKVLSVKG